MISKTLIVVLLTVLLLAPTAESWWGRRRRRRRRSPPPPQVCPTIPSGGTTHWHTCTNGRHVGSVCTFHCRNGYDVVGSTTSTCRSNCVWSAAFPTCRVSPRCPSIPWCIRRSHTCTNDRCVGSVCTFRCREGYDIVGSGTTTCQSNCAWSPAFPTCQVKTCSPALTSLPNGGVRCTNYNRLNSVCTYRCDDGYEFTAGATETRICGESGWSGTTPTCVVVHSCPNIPWSRRRSHTCTNGLNVGSVCTFDCRAGYTLVGPEESTCQDYCDWSPEFPTCEENCSPINHCPNGQVTCTDDNRVNSVCTFSCNNGYRFSPGSAPTCTCLGMGDWSGPPPTCVNIVYY